MTSLVEILSNLVGRQKLDKDEARVTIKGKVELDGIIHGKDNPRDRPGIVICHGVGMFQRLYSGLARYIARKGGFRVLTFNFRGHGRDQRVELTLDGALEDVRNAVRHMVGQGHSRVILIGHSLGAIISLKLVSKEKPPALKALVLIGCPTDLSSVELRAMAVFFFARIFANVDISEIRKKLKKYRPEADIKKLEKGFPVCVVYGHFDEFVRILFRQKLTKLKKLAPSEEDIDLKVMETLSHTPFLKDEYKQEIVDWIKGVE